MAILSGLLGALDRVARSLSDFADMLNGLTATGNEVNGRLREQLDLDAQLPLIEQKNGKTEARKARV